MFISGLHVYSHEVCCVCNLPVLPVSHVRVISKNPVSLTLEQQRDILDHTYNLLTEFNHGIPPKGSVAPWWETSKEGSVLLLEKGIEYGTDDSSHQYVSLTQNVRPFAYGARVRLHYHLSGT